MNFGLLAAHDARHANSTGGKPVVRWPVPQKSATMHMLYSSATGEAHLAHETFVIPFCARKLVIPIRVKSASSSSGLGAMSGNGGIPHSPHVFAQKSLYR